MVYAPPEPVVELVDVGDSVGWVKPLGASAPTPWGGSVGVDIAWPPDIRPAA